MTDTDQPIDLNWHKSIAQDTFNSHNEIGDFDLAFGYEAVARALKLSGDQKGSRHYVDLAEQAAQKIASDEDKRYFLSELNTI